MTQLPPPPPRGAVPADAPALPTLPPPAPAPTPATGDSPAAAPLVPPTHGTADAALPRQDLAVPVPGLPPLPGAAPEAPLAPPLTGHGSPGVPDGLAPATKRPKRRRRWPLFVGAAVVGVAAPAAWLTVGPGAEDSSDSSDVEVARETGDLPADGSTIGQIGVDAIDDAEVLVDEINDRSAEAEVLAELGLDPTGEPIDEPVAPADPVDGSGGVDGSDGVDGVVAAPAQGHRFTWSYGALGAAEVVVDTTTGDYWFESTDGLGFRLVDGRGYVTRGDSLWSEIDPNELESIPRLGLDAPITVDQIVGGDVAPYLASAPGGPGEMAWTLDDEAFAAAEPVGRATWLASVGIQPLTADPATTVTLTVAADGVTVTSLTVESPAHGLSSWYVLEQVYDIAPDIPPPTIVAADS